MSWLHDHGLISKFEDYFDLPISVIDDTRAVMDAEAVAAAAERERERRSGDAGPGRGRAGRARN